MAHPLLTYLKSLAYSMPLGVKETSGYPALKALLDEVGAGLKPKVRCIIHPKSAGAGIPDGGLFLADRFKGQPEPDMFGGLNPDRGVIEVKDVSADVGEIARGEQVAKYLERYGLVLVTNYREFRLVGKDADGHLRILEKYTLAENVTAFQAMLGNPSEAVRKHGPRFVDFLQRVMLRQATLSEPGDVAWLLASYAREALALVEDASALPALDSVRKALSDALGLEFKGGKGEHFFRSTLVQTLFYGLFSAWVLWRNEGHTGRFGWRTAQWEIRVPVLRALFERVASPSNVNTLGLLDVLNAAADALNRVDTEVFFKKFRQEHAVQYFYEPFLAAFDPVLRKDLGVWYTPPEIVRYQVSRVDTVLKEELGIADGLADPRVYVLDPCCGTGAYLVETLRHVAETLKESQGEVAMAQLLKEAARERIFGFEILPAPFVVSHLQIGALLQSLGAPLEGDDERAGVFLTNALTGWEPPKEPKTTLPFIELEQERDAAEQVKREKPILVILGNPPYNGFAGVAVDEERDLSMAYRTTERVAPPQGQGLNDLYVRFFRMAERRIVEATGEGIVCFISNYAWLDGLSFTGMRERYLDVFDRVWVDCLNGDSRQTGKKTPDGKPDPSVFSTEHSSVGIQVGTAIALLVRRKNHGMASEVSFRHLWGTRKLQELEMDAVSNEPLSYDAHEPELALGLPFKPRTVATAYLTWPKLTEVFPVSFPGVKTSRDDVVVDIDRGRLVDRMTKYFDPKISHEQMRHISPGAMDPSQRFQPEIVRDTLRRRGIHQPGFIRFAYRPFDVRWLYWEPETKLLDEKRSEYLPHVTPDNVWMVTQQRPRRDWSRAQFIRSIGCLDLMDRGASCVPLYLAPTGPASLYETGTAAGPRPNLTDPAMAHLTALGLTPDVLFFHALAAMHAPSYQIENEGALRQDWPRIPLPGWPNPPAEVAPLLVASADLGRRVAALLDTERDVPGVTGLTGVQPDLQPVGVLKTAGKQADFRVTAGWGHKGQGGVTMPGRGKVEPCMGADGMPALNVYLNATTYWANVPKAVWEYTIGGYQVMKKWLSYREMDILGRAITAEEAREVTNMARRIAALVALREELDANYERIKGTGYCV